jgi:hypothetical protein
MRAALRGRRVLADADARDPYRQTVARIEANEHFNEAENAATPAANLRRAGREAIPEYEPGEQPTPERQRMLDVLDNPKSINVEASEQRLEAAIKAGVVPMALDAADSAQSTNSFETMICHQAAIAHKVAMEFGAKALDEAVPTIERVRLANAAGLMMRTFQEGLLALVKTRNGGKQTVVVQYVQTVVADGGRAVVAGVVTPRDPGGDAEGEG